MKKIWKAVTGLSIGEQGLIPIHVVVSNDWPRPGWGEPKKSLAQAVFDRPQDVCVLSISATLLLLNSLPGPVDQITTVKHG
jgi:hypothetical protein